MRKVTLRGLLAHKLRLALTALAIVLGVTFISGTFVLTDTLNATFSSLFTSVYQKVDFQVRGVAQLGSGADATRNPLSESLLATVRGVPGVASANGEVQGYAEFVGKDGKPISTGGSPTLGVAYDRDQRISSLHLIAGSPPTAADDVVMDAGTAHGNGFTVGQRVRVLSAAAPPQTFTITGIAQFGTADNLAGSTLAAFTLPTAQRVVGEVGLLDTISVVAKPGTDKAVVQRDIAQALPAGAEVVTGQTVVNEDTNSVSQGLSFFGTALLVFALISLFVGAFTIYNTFSIIVGQRTRELALLRIVGASRRQVFRSVLAEAAIIGALSSAVGVGLGVLTEVGLEALLSGFGVSLPTGPLTFEARTAVVGLLVGTLVTVAAAIGPARQAVRIPPVAALSSRQAEAAGSLRRRVVIGTCVTVGGALFLAVGLSGAGILLVGVGAACVFVGAAMLAPAVARPLSGALGRPLASWAGTAGRLGRENSMRSPRRTAQTASALMVGLALVSAMSVFGASLSASATSSVDQAISADLLVTANGIAQLSDGVSAAAAKVPGVTAAATVYFDIFEFKGGLYNLTGVPPKNLGATVMVRITSGSIGALAAGQLLIDSTTAKSKHLAVGDSVPVKFTQTGPATMRIGGIFQANALIQHFLVSSGFFLAHYRSPHPGAVLLRTDGRPGIEQAVVSALASYSNVQVQSRAQFDQAQVSSVNQLLGLVYALLALAVLIAMVGIVNTLMLSVLERTKEIGLLRAVGMRRPQVRTMIRAESVILATFGAIIGIVIGTLMGLALVASLRDQGITSTAVPVVRLAEFLVLAAVLGLVAASWPARRAAKLNVLTAIAAE
jgi:putative ABC transport system permease protein